MSALTPHIRVLRAEAEALRLQCDEIRGETSQQMTVQMTLLALANSKLVAADALEAEEHEREARLAG